MSVKPATLEKQAQALYAQFGYGYTRDRLNLTTSQMKSLLIDAGASPCPRDHVLTIYVAGDANRPRQAVTHAAARAGVLRRTSAPNAGKASATSVPKRWAGEYVTRAKRYDRAEELWTAGWLTSETLAGLFQRQLDTVTRAAHHEGPLAAYLEPVERHTAYQWHAWEPRGTHAALDTYREHQHEAATSLVPLRQLQANTGRGKQAVKHAARRVHAITCHAPASRRTAAFVRPTDAAAITEKLKQ